MLQYSGYPASVDHLRGLVLGSLPAALDRRTLENCRVKSRCGRLSCPACSGRTSYIQGQRVLAAAEKMPPSRLKVATLTAADVYLDGLRDSVTQIMQATRKTLRNLGVAHYAAKSETSVASWADSFHPHVHAVVNTAAGGKSYIRADDWTNEWLSALPSYLHPPIGGAHVRPVRNLEGACRYFTKSPFRYATSSTIGSVLGSIAALEGVVRFSTSGAFRTQN
jgi:hypothetical protein